MKSADFPRRGGMEISAIIDNIKRPHRAIRTKFVTPCTRRWAQAQPYFCRSAERRKISMVFGFVRFDPVYVSYMDRIVFPRDYR